jgi:guanosine-3',5'-bis(diphosphate) 3'-pyrophosphohydrolase
VAEVIARVGGVTDLAVLQAAALHNTLEDTKTTREELVERFGEEVAGIVVEVTDDKQLEKAERKRRQVEHAPHLSRAAKLVKLGDKICNVQDVLRAPPRKWSTERRAEYVAWSLAVVDGCRGTNAALERHFDALVEEARAACTTTRSASIT